MALPNPYLPGLIPLLVFSTTLCLHALLWLFQVWYISFRTKIQFSECKDLTKATYVRATPKPHSGKQEIVPLIRTPAPDGKTTFHFIFQRRKYVSTEGDNGEIVFKKVKPLISRSVSKYLSSRGVANDLDLAHLREQYGKNEFSIPQPEFKELYLQQLIQPIIVFELFSTFLWLLDEYWQYSLFSAFMILVCEATTVFSRMKSLQMLKGMGNTTRDIMVFRRGEWGSVPTTDLVPGDIVSIVHTNSDNVIPCDCLLLSGQAVVNEASLTGESHPQMKEEITEDPETDVVFEMKGVHKVNTLFGGTTLMQHNATKRDHSDDFNSKKIGLTSPDGGCIAYVLRTGFDSSQGKLVSMIEHSVGNGQVRDDSWDALFLVLFLTIFAVVASGYVLVKGLANKDRNHFDLLLHCVMIITSVIPPSLPMQTAMGVQYAFLTLMKLNIFCTEQFRIPTAGKVNVCLFDKTGKNNNL